MRSSTGVELIACSLDVRQAQLSIFDVHHDGGRAPRTHGCRGSLPSRANSTRWSLASPSSGFTSTSPETRRRTPKSPCGATSSDTKRGLYLPPDVTFCTPTGLFTCVADRTAQVAHGVDVADAKRRILTKLAARRRPLSGARAAAGNSPDRLTSIRTPGLKRGLTRTERAVRYVDEI